MKKRILLWAVAVIALAGCSKKQTADILYESGEPGIVASAEAVTPEMVASAEATAPESVTNVEDSTVADTEIIDDTWQEYYYSVLSPEEQQVYKRILSALENSETDVEIALPEEAFQKIFNYVLYDHPEIFYVDGYTYIQYREGDALVGQAFSGSYIYSSEEIRALEQQIAEKVTGILAKAPKRDTEYEKAKFVYQYLIENTEYVPDAENNQNICSVFLNGCSVCQGYAKGAQYLLHELGVNAALVTGTADFGEEHAWNIVEIDGKYYHMDVTWGDASYTLQGQETSSHQATPEINYEYLCIPDSQLFLTHKPDTELQLPVCDSLDANYYVMEGAYFTRADLGQTEALFQKAKTKEKFFVSFKCADAGVYAEMEEVLIGEQRVFAFLPTGAQTIAFSKNEEQLILSFWLQD